MSRLITYGTFDLFHHGHLRLLRRCSALASEIHVGVSTDAFNMEKGKRSVWGYSRRSREVLETGLVTSVFPERSFEQKPKDITRLGANLFIMGDDWKGQFDWLVPFCDVIYLPRTPNISTTLLKSKLNWTSNDSQCR
ncbi:adenylyltransferase/cytidyltransferase family protein [Planktotalea arctica]|uniref:adenylyltransferase/cytidyltransferase family protein n=1 Tax=Planktotalea arctica TaxID=1481893 RepID=UPI0032199322